MWLWLAVVVGALRGLCVGAVGGEDPRAAVGYPVGLMTMCPGSDKPASIPRPQLKYLGFVVQGPGAGKAPSRRRHSYWSALNGSLARDPRIDLRRKTMVIFGGYLDSPNLPFSNFLANEYQRLGFNIILVDAQRYATVHYHLASRLTRPVGKHVAEALARLASDGAGSLELLGYSLGGHTVAYVADHFQRIAGRNISAITALEPSGPCFRALPRHKRLRPEIADFVQVVHTNVDGYGMATPMGHVDFYVNGGEYQPSDLLFYPCGALCSHFRMLSLWLAVLRNLDRFIAVRCNSVQEARDAACFGGSPVTNRMGPRVDPSRPGIYYLSTSKDFPYYLGTKGLNATYVYWRTITDVNNGNETEIYT